LPVLRLKRTVEWHRHLETILGAVKRRDRHADQPGVRSMLPGRRGRRLATAGAVWALVLLVAPGLLTRDATPDARNLPDLPPVRKSGEHGRLSHVVAVLAGRGAVAYCWSSADWQQRRDPWHRTTPRWSGPWGAYVSAEPVLTVNLAPNECTMLKLLMRSKRPVWNEEHPAALAWSVHVLAHESVHVSGHYDEVKAECWGLQLTARTAVELGRTAKEGRYLADLAWKQWYPRTPAAYRSPACRDGGSLDLRRKSRVWP
jgi:hypothetical protein